MTYLLGVAFIVMTFLALWYKARADRAEEWVWYIVSEVEKAIEDDKSEA